MKTNKCASSRTVLSLALLSALGAAAIAPQASAVILADGLYNVYVNTTPTFSTYYNTLFQVGKDGAWNSSFIMGGNPPTNITAAGMTDNGATSGTGQGSGIAGDGYAGHWQISVSGNTVTFVSFAQDTIFGTAANDFAQYGTVTGTGSIDQTTGALTITPTGRLAAINSPVRTDVRWNVYNCATTTACIDNGNTTWTALTTGTASSYSYFINGATYINGANVTATADIDSDGLADYSAILVSGGLMGADICNFCNAGYYEIYNIRLEFISGVPIPAAVWLFGSGLLGLGAMARRQRQDDLAT